MKCTTPLIERIAEDAFFFGGEMGRLGPIAFSKRRHAGLNFISWIYHLVYMTAVIDGNLDQTIDELAMEELTVDERDFTGPDFTAYARDLFRPDEANEARGAHPSGVGISRYVKWSDLAANEQNYLRLQTKVHFLNLINPGIFNIRGFLIDENTMFSARVSHQLAPFGYDLALRALIDLESSRIGSRLHAYFNESHTLPGLELWLIDYSMSAGGFEFKLKPSIGLWMQPTALRFDANNSKFGGYLGLELAVPIKPWLHWNLEALATSEGWISGLEYLDAQVIGRTGVSFILDN